VCTLARFKLFVDLLDQVCSQDMVIIGVSTHYHLDLFALQRACFLPSAAGVSGSSISHILPLRDSKEAG
jgi:hypothetical protein